MKKLPNETSLILRQTGDGFREVFLLPQLTENDVLIGKMEMLKYMEDMDCKAQSMTFKALIMKGLRAESNRIIVDTNIPNLGSQAADELIARNLDSTILFLHPIGNSVQLDTLLNLAPVMVYEYDPVLRSLINRSELSDCFRRAT